MLPRSIASVCQPSQLANGTPINCLLAVLQETLEDRIEDIFGDRDDDVLGDDDGPGGDDDADDN